MPSVIICLALLIAFGCIPEGEFGERPVIEFDATPTVGSSQNVQINFTVSDADCSFTTVYVYYFVAGDTWQQATLVDCTHGVATGTTITDIHATVDGVHCTATWDTLADGIGLDGDQAVSITVRASDIDGPGVTAVPVGPLLVNNNCARLVVAETSIEFGERLAGVAETAGDERTLTITNGTGANGTVLYYEVASDQSWLQVTPASGTTPVASPYQVTVTLVADVDGAGLAATAMPYPATLTVVGRNDSAAGSPAFDSPVTVPVQVAVRDPEGELFLHDGGGSAPPALAQFVMLEGAANPAPQSFWIENAGESGSVLSWSADDDLAASDWLPGFDGATSGSLNAAQSTEVPVAVDGTGLAVGSYSATITVYGEDATTHLSVTGSPQTVAVSLEVLPENAGYRVIDLTTYEVTDAASIADLLTNDDYRTTKLVLKRVFVGGYLSQDFYFGVFEVTQRQWYTVTGAWPSFHQTDPDKRPVELVDWNTCQSFLATIASSSGEPVRFPTQVEWDYACRAGTTTLYSYGDAADGAYMWYTSNSGGETHEVGTRLPNPWGLYDVHGNVWEFVGDTDGADARWAKGGAFDSIGCASGVRASMYDDSYGDNRGLRVAIATGDDLPTVWTHPGDRVAYVGQSAIFTVEAVGAGTLSYQWRRDGGDIAGANAAAYTTPATTLGDDGAQFTCVVSNAGGSVVSDAATLTVNPPGGPAYKIVDLVAGTITDVDTVPGLTGDATYKTTKLVMRRIEPGTFVMGDQVGGHRDRELPLHSVNITRPFYMGVFEVTEGQWFEVMGDRPGYFDGDVRPVDSVSWNRIRQFTAQLVTETGHPGFRLPSEAEWEYTCKAGSSTNFFYGAVADPAYTRFDESSPTEVGLRLPNPWGIYDMHGNIEEACLDPYDEYYYTYSVADNPHGPGDATYRSERGGYYGDNQYEGRSSTRMIADPTSGSQYKGFRLLLDPATTPSITVTRPNSGEAWAIAGEYHISWYWSAVPGTVDIHYSTDGGATWIEIASGEDNDGGYRWTVPDTPSSNCLVRVKATDGSASDQSDSPFTISANGTVWYVDVDAPAGGDGTSWASAFRHPQDAVDAAILNDVVWVAQGTYTRAGDDLPVLHLVYGVTVRGGYAGLGEANPDARDPVACPSIIHGSSIAHHVVEMADASEIDGLTITGGNADGGPYLYGHHGGGLISTGDVTAVVRNCAFEDNSADGGGSAIYAACTRLDVIDCTFTGNASLGGGGAVQVEGTTGSIAGCTFTGNDSLGGEGSGVSLLEAYPPFRVTGCTFLDNTGVGDGALHTYFCNVDIDNCVMTGNAPYGISVDARDPVFVNCTVTGNTQGGITVTGSSDIATTNCIFWGNASNEITCDASSTCAATYCCVEGGYAGTGNISADPLFVNAEAGNVQLQSGSPCIDAADGDAAPSTDFDGQGRVDDPGVTNTGTGTPAYVDMGAYERQ